MTNDNLDNKIVISHSESSSELFQTHITQKCTANRKSLYAVHFCISWGEKFPR